MAFYGGEGFLSIYLISVSSMGQQPNSQFFSDMPPFRLNYKQMEHTNTPEGVILLISFL